MERRRRKGENLSVQGMGPEWSFAGFCKAAEKWWRLRLLLAKEEEEKDSWDMRKRNKEEGFIYTLVDLQKYVSYFE
jgi:hypothetical protein